MEKRFGWDSIIVNALLILFAVSLAVGLFYWINNYTQTLPNVEETTEENVESVENTKIKIQDVETTGFNSELKLTLENQGKLAVEQATVRVIMKNGDVHSELFPKKIEYPSGFFDLKFFQVKQFTVFFDDNIDISDYKEIEIFPVVRLEDGSLKRVDSAMARREAE